MVTDKLVILIIVLGTALGGYIYWRHLTGKVEDLTQKVQVLEATNKKLKEDLDEVTASREAFEKASKNALNTVSELDAELKKRKTDIRYVQVPSNCPDAVQWLVDEVTR